MGKVQKTISRIGQRLKHRPLADVALIIPSQQIPAKASFPTTYSGVSRWLTAQADSHSETPVATLLKALQHSNRLQTSPAERLRITDLFRTSLQRKLPHLNTQYIGMDLPYEATGQFAFEQVSTVLQELSYGYKIALADVLSGNGRLTRKYRIYAIFRAMMATGECGLRHSQSYCQWPDKSWRDLNSLMLLADSDNAADEIINVDGKEKQSKPKTIQQLYKSLAAFYVSKTGHLQALQMDSLFAALCRHSDSIALNSEKAAHSTALFSVALNSDHPPAADIFCRYADDKKVRFLSLQNLSDTLLVSDSIEQNQSALSKQQITKLSEIWTNRTKRNSARSVRHKPFSTEIGIKEIACSLKACSGANPVWQNNQFQTDWTLVNQSENGIGLRSQPGIDYRVSVGEIIAYTPEHLTTNTAICHIGIIRWIHNHGARGLQIGAETISRAVQAATVDKVVKGVEFTAPKIDALLYTDHSQTPDQLILLLPRQQFKLGETINLHTHNSDYTTQMKLAEKREYSGYFECFTLKSVTRKPQSAIQTVMQRAVEKQTTQ